MVAITRFSPWGRKYINALHCDGGSAGGRKPPGSEPGSGIPRPPATLFNFGFWILES